MNRYTIKELRQKLDSGELTSVELVEHYQKRIEQFDPKLNAFITKTFESALEEAKAADECIKRGEQTLLTGIPIAHKDLVCTEGVLTTAASKMLANFTSPYSATLAEKLKEAGAISLGKLNMDEFAMGSTGQTSFFGGTENPWSEACVAGGSSSGSAAAVGAGLVVAATGSDTGGSIRQPASFCGVTGIKPTYGRVSRFGMIAFASSLDQGGVLSGSAEDCAALLEVMSGYDPKDPTSVERDVPAYTDELDRSLKGLKIGVPKAFFAENLDEETEKAVNDALAEYEKLGAELVDVELKLHHLVTPVYYVVAPAEASSNLSRFDGIRYGYRAEDPKDLEDLYKRTRFEGFGKEVRSRIFMGTYALTEELYQDYYLKAQKIRRQITDEYNAILREVDVIAGPTVASGAFQKDADNSGVQNSLFDANLIGANLAGLPALSHPVGFSNNLPVGLHLVGRAFDETTILAMAHQYQTVTDWHKKLPEKYS